MLAAAHSALCSSRRELSNAYLLAKFRFDTAENEPAKNRGGLRRRVPRRAEPRPELRGDPPDLALPKAHTPCA